MIGIVLIEDLVEVRLLQIDMLSLDQATIITYIKIEIQVQINKD